MLTLSLLCVAGMLPQGGSPAPVVINEFIYRDSPAFDDHEIVELYNASPQPVDLSGWTLETTDGSITRSWSVTAGTVLAAGGFYVMGGDMVPQPKQELTSYWLSSPRPRNLFFNDTAALVLKDGSGAIVDSVHYEVNLGLWPGANPEGEGLWGSFIAWDVFPLSLQRAADGVDTDRNGDDFVLLPWTPGASNIKTDLFPYAAAFEGTAVEAMVRDWGTTGEFPHVIDPTRVTTHNPNAIPPSPQGGNALSFWPNAGANAATNTMLWTTLPVDVVFEAWVYFDAVPEVVSHETWSIGFGSTDRSYQPPDPAGAFGTTRNGNMGGVAWTLQVTQSGGVLYLIDHNDGGWGPAAVTPPTILRTIPIIAGQNDGWQKLRLERSGSMILGSFGGSRGCADGDTTWAEISSNNPTTLYVAYRESIPDNSTARPPTLDDVVVRSADSLVRPFGSAVATTRGTPALSAMGPPTLGHRGWGLALSGLVPSQATLLMVGVNRTPVPFDLAAVGGQPGSLVEIAPLVALALPTDAQGAARLRLGIPCQAQLIGQWLFWQAFDPDPALSFALPLGNSGALETRIGQ